jgi:hypothetical protein
MFHPHVCTTALLHLPARRCCICSIPTVQFSSRPFVHRYITRPQFSTPLQTIMFRVRTSTRLLDISTSTGILRAGSGYTHPQTTALSTKNKTCTPVPPITLPYHQTLAAFSTRYHGLRKSMLSDFELVSSALGRSRAGKPPLQRASADRTPFDGPEARNVIAFLGVGEGMGLGEKGWVPPMMMAYNAVFVKRRLNHVVRTAGISVSHASTTPTTSRQD